jgi:sensor histidine kinase YesM
VTVDGTREARLPRIQLRAAARDLLLWALANSLAGGLVGLAIAIFSGAPGAIPRFIWMGTLFGNAIGFAAGLSARFVLPRYVALPPYLRFPLAVITLLAGGAFGTVLVIIMNPLTVLYQGRLLSLLIIVDSIVAVVVGLIVYNYERMRDAIELGYRALAENQVREERLRELAARSELKALKAQINPHFLFNALNSVSALISIDPDAAQRTLARLAGILRGTLLASEKESIPLGQELEVVDAYLDVEKARFGKRLHVEQQVSPEARDVPVPPLIVQPVVENAIRHGISPRVEGGTVRILAEVKSGRLHIVVEDNGAGMDPGRREALMAGGFGLRNVRDRLTTRFGPGEWFRIEGAMGEGMRVELVVPIEAPDQEETP